MVGAGDTLGGGGSTSLVQTEQAEDITVTMRNGVVRLAGTVTHGPWKQQCARAQSRRARQPRAGTMTARDIVAGDTSDWSSGVACGFDQVHNLFKSQPAITENNLALPVDGHKAH